jgi:hypothetical protein
VFSGVVLGNILFMFCRSFLKQKLIISQDNLLTTQNTDQLEALGLHLSIFVTFAAPAFCFKVITYEYEVNTELFNDSGNEFVSRQSFITVWQTVGMLYLTFFSFIRSPVDSMQDIWFKVVPYVHLLVTLCVFFIGPGFILLDTLFSMKNVNASLWRSTIWMNFLNAGVTLFIWMPTQIYGIVNDGIRYFKKQNENMKFRIATNATNWQELKESNYSDESVTNRILDTINALKE